MLPPLWSHPWLPRSSSLLNGHRMRLNSTMRAPLRLNNILRANHQSTLRIPHMGIPRHPIMRESETLPRPLSVASQPRLCWLPIQRRTPLRLLFHLATRRLWIPICISRIQHLSPIIPLTLPLRRPSLYHVICLSGFSEISLHSIRLPSRLPRPTQVSIPRLLHQVLPPLTFSLRLRLRQKNLRSLLHLWLTSTCRRINLYHRLLLPSSLTPGFRGNILTSVPLPILDTFNSTLVSPILLPTVLSWMPHHRLYAPYPRPRGQSCHFVGQTRHSAPQQLGARLPARYLHNVYRPPYMCARSHSPRVRPKPRPSCCHGSTSNPTTSFKLRHSIPHSVSRVPPYHHGLTFTDLPPILVDPLPILFPLP